MARGKCLFKETDVARAVRAVEAAGHNIARVEIGTDGKITIVPGTPPAEEKKGPPNTFDRVLGGAA
jgi:hypothetical protein